MIENVLSTVPLEQRAEVKRKLLGSAPAEAVAQVLWDYGFAISPSTIRTYRRLMRPNGDKTE
ncbi:hypothetical protein [Cellulomonas sp. SG140]|uniref:hypothetical protein n=1 Tax=Cellulomonas sp. SG140 TaxID=2976536 RepID=UPI0021E90FBE|nr:hypothetical protein [Cellulomonas sp. SG140]